MQKLMLDAMTNMMAAGKELGASKGVNVFAVAMDEAEGIDALEKLQEQHSLHTKSIHSTVEGHVERIDKNAEEVRQHSAQNRSSGWSGSTRSAITSEDPHSRQ